MENFQEIPESSGVFYSKKELQFFFRKMSDLEKSQNKTTIAPTESVEKVYRKVGSDEKGYVKIPDLFGVFNSKGYLQYTYRSDFDVVKFPINPNYLVDEIWRKE